MACVFCNIIAKALPAHVVLEDEETLAFLDTRPVFHGHVLLVPKEHVVTLADLAPSKLGPLFANAQRLMRALEKGIGAEGTFVAVNNTISQSVPHLHVHVVPRRKKDGLKGFFWPRHPYPDDDAMRAMVEKLRDAL